MPHCSQPRVPAIGPCYVPHAPIRLWTAVDDRGNRLQSPSVNQIFSLSLTPIRADAGLRPGPAQSRTARYPRTTWKAGVLDQQGDGAHDKKPGDQGAEHPIPLRRYVFRTTGTGYLAAPYQRRVLLQPQIADHGFEARRRLAAARLAGGCHGVRLPGGRRAKPTTPRARAARGTGTGPRLRRPGSGR